MYTFLRENITQVRKVIEQRCPFITDFQVEVPSRAISFRDFTKRMFRKPSHSRYINRYSELEHGLSYRVRQELLLRRKTGVALFNGIIRVSFTNTYLSAIYRPRFPRPILPPYFTVRRRRKLAERRVSPSSGPSFPTEMAADATVPERWVLLKRSNFL